MDGRESVQASLHEGADNLGSVDLAGWRAAVESLFDIDPLETPFHASIETFRLGEIVFAITEGSSQLFVRDERVIARSGADQVLVQMYTRGGFECSIGDQSHIVEVGDISCLDLSQPFTSKAPAFAAFSLLIPRRMLGLATDGGVLHGRVLPAQLARARVLGGHLRTLAQASPIADQFDRDVLGMLTATLCEAAFVGRSQSPEAPGDIDRSMFAEIGRYIEANLADHTLSAERLADEFGASRATLYRMFRRSGGVASFIRERRLDLAHRALTIDPAARERISILARRCGFKNEDTFARAFKERYGAAPTKQRNQALRPR